MSNKANNLTDIETKGFTVIPHFLSTKEIKLFIKDINTQVSSENKNYNLLKVADGVLEKISHKNEALIKQVSTETSIEPGDLRLSAFYLATKLGVNFGWHSDHEDYFITQHHYNLLNFYIPIVKPDPKQSNLTVVPFDKLEKIAPELCRKLVGYGATSFMSDQHNRKTYVMDDNLSQTEVYDLNLDDIAETPFLSSGDLLLMRGDVIHRTQDVNTERVALSVRYHCSKDMLNMRKFLAMGYTKLRFMLNNPTYYLGVLDFFADQLVDLSVVDSKLIDQTDAKTNSFNLTQGMEGQWILYYIDGAKQRHLIDMGSDVLKNIKSKKIDDLTDYDILRIKRNLQPYLEKILLRYDIKEDIFDKNFSLGDLISFVS
ncbi:MAG: hypothetical protein A3F13_08745 [Gammaproteobacteria bacterium RIFCSPHIGHO2_12_FULL_40_19]|nr:MAG: hypothetical protein A3F13_08745 [Gammaproteobacteria bacterium RIFCSPHIGHO2_12_FULL_40_19]